MPATMTKEALFVANQFASMISRTSLAALQQGGNGVDLDKECGYPPVVTHELCQWMYDREGIGTRVVKVMPEESWADDPEIYDDEDENVESAFEQGIEDLYEEQDLIHYLERADEQSGIGCFGVLLIGIDDGLPLNQPIAGMDEMGRVAKGFTPQPRKIIYLRVLAQKYVQIATWQADPNNPRNGHPVLYNLIMMDPQATGISTGGDVNTMRNVQVHWSRVIHLADNRTSSEVMGVPRMQQVYNRLCDLRKLLGGSAEMFWKGAFPGIAFEMDPEVAAEADLDPELVRKEMERYQTGLQRFIAVQGMSAKSLAVQVAEPETHFDVQVKAVCITIGCPMRVFTGSEQGQLASGQDSKTWNRRVSRRQKRYCTPMIIRPTIDRFIVMGVLPKPKDDKYTVKWPDLNTPSDNEKADRSLKLTQAIGQYTSSGAEAIFPLLEFLTIIMDIEQETAQQIVDAATSSEDLLTDPGDPGHFDPETGKPTTAIGNLVDKANHPEPPKIAAPKPSAV
jgi:hypothetical protein